VHRARVRPPRSLWWARGRARAARLDRKAGLHPRRGCHSAGATAALRRRYVIAHELGHHLLHAPTGQLSLCTDGDFLRYDAAAGDAEEEANWFAAALLMPEPLFKPKCEVQQPTLAVVRALATAFSTTQTATAIRFVELCPEACSVVWSERGVIKWAIRGPDFWPWIEFGRQLESYTHAADAFNGKPIPKEPQIVPARAWTNKDGGDIYEDTEWFSSLGATLSLLWLPS